MFSETRNVTFDERNSRLYELELVLGEERVNRLNQAEREGVREGASVVGTLCAIGGAVLFMGANGGNFGLKESIFYVGAIALGSLFGAERGRYYSILDEVNHSIRESIDNGENLRKWFSYKIPK